MHLCRKTTLTFLVLVSSIFLFSDSAQARRGKTTFSKMTIEDVGLSGKTVLIRVDFNVPLKDGVITDDTRIRAALPTIQYALEQGAKIVLTSHLGRPKGEVVPELSLAPIARRLSELLGINVGIAPDCIGNEVESMVSNLRESEILLLENIRFHSEETENDPVFARSIASLADVFVNDAFGSSHRAHASVVGVADYLPTVSGYLLDKEITYFEQILNAPEHPFYAILGGAKVSDKIAVIENLLNLADKIFIGGGMAYTFLAAQGIEIGNSKLEEDKIELARGLLAKAAEMGKEIILPIDHIVAEEISEDAEVQIVTEIPEGMIALDIGPQTRELFKEALGDAGMVVWNGPLGFFEIDAFSHGSRDIAEFIASLDAIKVVGGGDTASCIESFGLIDGFSHISTGGGASLEYLEGKILPGVSIINTQSD